MDDGTFEIICNRCRTSVRSDVDVCPVCGAVLFMRDPPPAPPKPVPAEDDQPKRRRLWRRH
jgi:hypothetical protein